MKQLRLLSGLFVLALLVLALAGPVPRVEAQRDVRTIWEVDSGNRRFRLTKGKNWAEYRDGKLVRQFKEQARNGRFIEMYTAVPTPIWVRLYPKHLQWKGQTDTDWRKGANGGWLE